MDRSIPNGLSEQDMNCLKDYCNNAFHNTNSSSEDQKDALFLWEWDKLISVAKKQGVAKAINDFLIQDDQRVKFLAPELMTVEILSSPAGSIPIITAADNHDFENLVRFAVYRGKEVRNLDKIGAMFAYGKTKRFIIISEKPYSGITASDMNLTNEEWKRISRLIRCGHECTHYYTKRFWGSARNNLHDELIADFIGILDAFGFYRAKWFQLFLGIGTKEDKATKDGRLCVYVQDLTEKVAAEVERIAIEASEYLEKWSVTNQCISMTNAERISFLCSKGILEWQ